MKIKLREQTFENMHTEVPIHELPVVFEGNLEDAHDYAAKNGYVWKDSPKMLFGGWFYKTPHGKNNPGISLLPTL